MGDDLGTGAAEVHAAAAEVLDFWFALDTERQFGKDPALDREIGDRFGTLRERVADADAEAWQETPETLLAAIILLDQFTRNLHRGEATAYACDPLALELALVGIARGYDVALPPERRAFLYMPLMHAEDRGVQRFSLRCFAALGNESNLRFARDHAAVIEEYGRYPSRNAALGRPSTPAEEAYLRTPGAGW